MAEKRRRSSKRRTSTGQKLRQEAKIRKIIWISAGGAIALAIIVIFLRYLVLSIT
jgi:hypothetical protein